jgi:hypothetical protein
MSTAAASREIRGREEIVRPDFHPGKQNSSAELTADSPGQMASVIDQRRSPMLSKISMAWRKS